MNPEDIARKVRESKVGQAASKAHSAADKVYQSLTRPDRPLEPETHKKPWLAALLSLFIVGAGQLYNRQLLKAVFLFVLFYIVGVVLVVVDLLLYWLWEAARPTLDELGFVFKFIWAGLWLFAVLDAWRIARLLKSGKMVIRYGFLRQSVFAAVSVIPVAGALSPSEAIAPEEANKVIGEVAVDLAKERILKWLLIRLLRFGCLGLGGIIVLLGVILDVHFLLTLGSLIILVGILLFLV